MIAFTPSWADDITVKDHCRVCDGTDLVIYCDLGVQPLANAFLHREDVGLPEFTAPLRVQLCKTCGLSQLTHVVSPVRLYSRYLYVSGVSKGWTDHCENLAKEHLEHTRFVVDIAANDGSLLVPFWKRGLWVLGIEPAENITPVAPVPMLHEFWSSDLARQILAKDGPADLITATNVFGHVDDARDFLLGIAVLLNERGTAIIECPHIAPLLNMTAFDTIYHEHVSYWSLGPLQRLAREVGLEVYAIKPLSLHGGTFRYSLCHTGMKAIRQSVWDLVDHEALWALREPAIYEDFQHSVGDIVRELRQADLASASGIGASAKGNVLLNTAALDLQVIYDDSETKQGLFTPGRHIPVRRPTDLSGVDRLVLLSWNWSRNLKDRAHALGFKGKFLTPIPTPVWS